MSDETEITVITDAIDDDGHGGGTPCLVVFYGKNLGRRYPLEHDELVIGRSDSCHMMVDQDSVSRQHARVFFEDGKAAIADNGSTNGTFVNDERISGSLRLRDGDLIRIGQTIFKYLSGSNIEAKYHEEIYRLTTIDGLTQAFNKRYFLETLERETNRARRYDRLLSLVMFDIDFFKRTNDSFGHLAGDYVLRELAMIVSTNLRREDLFARYGGEEFAIVLPEIDSDGARLVCEKIRGLVEEHSFRFSEDQIPITISLGIYTLRGAEDELSGTQLIGLADAKLYEAKNGGRNRVCA